MPTIGINRDLLFKSMGRSYTESEFDELCFEFGIELDEVTSEAREIQKERGGDTAVVGSEEVVFKIEIPANRYDLLCVEGLTRALRIFESREQVPHYRVIRPQSPLQMHVKDSTKSIRPFVVSAVLRNVTFSPASYASFIDLQEKLHQNVCRKRSLVAIGTHDLDTIEGPFVYEARPPEQIRFAPLNQTREMTATELMKFYEVDSHLRSYLPLIRDSPVYPVISDRNGVVLSLPPIINGNHSKISLSTKNVLIECTATDRNKATIVLDTMVTMFSQHCADPFTVEAVDVVEVDGSVSQCPELRSRTETVSAKAANSHVGIEESAERIASLLTRMSLSAELQADGDSIRVSVPPTRADVLHACDVYEDVAIAFGFNSIAKKIPETNCIGEQFVLNKLTDKLRLELAMAGFTEVLTFALCSEDDVSVKLRKPLQSAARIANPKTCDFQVARTTLLPGLLKTVSSNKNMAMPLQLFEVADVVLLDSGEDVGARNDRRLAALFYGKTAGFEVIHGILDRVMQVLAIPTQRYRVVATEDSTYFHGRCADVVVDGRKVAILGVLHPDVVTHFDLAAPCSYLELYVQALA